jgi:hypothetical protein
MRQEKAQEAAAKAQAEANLAKQRAIRVFVRCHEEVSGYSVRWLCSFLGC